jgi:lysophospholipase L1-like esterase
MDDLIERHPEITFIHTTVPLRHSPDSVGVWIRELMGKPNNSKLDNVKRNQFNQLLRSNYMQSPIVDIAASESTYPDGTREAFKMDGQTYYSLIGEYTNDGGHLNENGRGWVAAAFVQELAQIIRDRANK